MNNPLTSSGQAEQRIAFLGAGNMGEALIKGILSDNPGASIGFYERNAERKHYIQSTYTVCSLETYSDLNHYEIIILSIKPQTIYTVIEELGTVILPKTRIISIAAGITISFLKRYFVKNPIIRVMPNTPALIKSGMSGIAYSRECSEQDKAMARSVFKTVGDILEVPESLINPVTAMSGSGPAYFYYLADIFARQGESLGLSYTDALRLISKTMEGAARMILNQETPPETLIKNVTSKGGTTEAALNVLRNKPLPDIINETIQAANRRARELAKD